MLDAGESGKGRDESSSSELEALKIENLLLKQKAELDDQFRKHIESVEEKIGKGELKLGVAGLIVLCIAWFGTYEKVETQVQGRLDKEFGAKEIQARISSSATEAAQRLIKKQLTDYSNMEYKRLRCATEKYARELFALRCRVDGGEFVDIRNVCISNGREIYHEASVTEIDCDEVAASAEGVGLQSSRR